MANSIAHSTNLEYINRQLDVHQTQGAKRIEQIASGQRLNRVGDDPASLDLANQFGSDLRAITQGNRNAQQGVHLLQLADGALAQITDLMQRMSALAVSAASPLLNEGGRQNIATEFAALLDEADRIASFTTFNDTPLLDREQTLTVQLGPHNTDTAPIPLPDTRPSGEFLALGGLSVGTSQDANKALTTLHQAEEKISALRGRIGALQNRVERYADTSAAAMEHLLSTQAAIGDVDLAQSVSAMTTAQILSQASGNLFVEAHADVDRIIALLGN